METGNGSVSTQLAHHHVLKATAVKDTGGGEGTRVKVKPQVVELVLEVCLAAHVTCDVHRMRGRGKGERREREGKEGQVGGRKRGRERERGRQADRQTDRGGKEKERRGNRGGGGGEGGVRARD